MTQTLEAPESNATPDMPLEMPTAAEWAEINRLAVVMSGTLDRMHQTAQEIIHDLRATRRTMAAALHGTASNSNGQHPAGEHMGQ